MEFSTWTDEQLAGQRLMAGFDGTHMDAALEHLIAGLRVGGLILFKRNIASPEQIGKLCRSAQACARGSGLSIRAGAPPNGGYKPRCRSRASRAATERNYRACGRASD